MRPELRVKMLTAKYILKTAALDDQTGEPPPGYLHETEAALDAQAASSEAPALPQRARGIAPPRKGNSYCLVLVRKINPANGELMLVQK